MSYNPKKCSFCGKTIPLGTGVMFIRNDAVTFWYCSSKCRKNSTVLRRDPRKLKWTRRDTRAPQKAAVTETVRQPARGKA